MFFQVIRDDEGNEVGTQAFLEEQEAPDPAVAILKRMDAFETAVEIQQILERLFLLRMIVSQYFVNTDCCSV